MHINFFNSSQTFTAHNKTTDFEKKYCRKQFIKYGLLGTAGCLTGYFIPLKKIDGPDVISSVNNGRKITMMKTKIPNEVGKYKNSGWGILIGISIAKISDLIFNN